MRYSIAQGILEVEPDVFVLDQVHLRMEPDGSVSDRAVAPDEILADAMLESNSLEELGVANRGELDHHVANLNTDEFARLQMDRERFAQALERGEAGGLSAERTRFFEEVEARFRAWFAAHRLDVDALMGEWKRRQEPEVRVAPLKYLAEHFLEVDRLIRDGSKQNAAIEEVAKKYGFQSPEGFVKMYRERHLDKKMKHPP